MKKILILLALTFSLISCGTEAAPTDVINPEADYVYFYGKTCPHCKELNAYMQENNTLSQYAIEKREVYGNAENQKMFQVVTAALNLREGEAGVPFVFNKKTQEYVIGTDPAIEWFPNTDSSVEEKQEPVQTPAETPDLVDVSIEGTGSLN